MICYLNYGWWLGDHLITECVYDSRGREGYTRGGMRAEDEMCMVFLHYYPAVPLAQVLNDYSPLFSVPNV